MNFTDSQLSAIQEDGNLIVVAGAGTGKTRTLVERCVQRLVTYSSSEVPPEQHLTIENILIVTFTDAAATEVRHRVRTRIEDEVKKTGNTHLANQLELLETAHISTLHSFCFRLIRQHFYELGLDPGMIVLTRQQADVLKLEVLDKLFLGLYSAEGSEASEARALLLEHFHGRDQRVRDLILELHHYTQTRPNPEGWYQAELNKLSNPEPTLWRQLFEKEVTAWIEEWAAYLRTTSPDNDNAKACAQILKEYAAKAPFEALDLIIKRDDKKCWTRGRTEIDRAELGSIFTEANFLNTLVPKDGKDPLAEDWKWFAKPARIIISLAREFERSYAASKQERGALDFHDLEQFALQLLWDNTNQIPTELARQWQERFRYVFVDEYQDINAAQDKIIFCLSRSESNANRFMVGDVKQSIYRFRQADPTIFRKYMDQVKEGAWKRFFLSHNFRSEERILGFVNELFSRIMIEEFGGISYDENAALQYGRKDKIPNAKQPEVEVHLICEEVAKEGEASSAEPEGDEEDLAQAEIEALWIGQQLQLIKDNGVVRNEKGEARKAEWKDMVILMRSLKNKVESYARVFEHLGIPLQLKRNTFYDSIEVLDLLNLLKVLDNPLQDIPLLAVLRSPFCGFSAAELAQVRLGLRKQPFWQALIHYATKRVDQDLGQKCARVVETINRWRDLGKHCSISGRLETILQETLYADWILTQPRGKQRQANVFQFVRIARDFDHLNGEGLYLFLRHIQQEQEASEDAEPAAGEIADAVRLISVHQSKGLEFPIVIIPDLNKRFNTQDLSSGLILDEQYGLCTHIRAETTGSLYPSLPYWVAARSMRKEIQAEEMRVLYVALTRAQSKLILVASPRKKQLEAWEEKPWKKATPHQIAHANCWLDWIGPCLTDQNAAWLDEDSVSENWTSRIINRATLRKGDRQETPIGKVELTDEQKAILLQKFSFNYQHAPATRQQAKSTVTRLRRGLMEAEETQVSRFARLDILRSAKRDSGGMELGKAYHAVLEHTPMEALKDKTKLPAYINRLKEVKIISDEQAAHVKPDLLTQFWISPIGSQIAEKAEYVQRELPFTAKFSGADLKEFEAAAKDLAQLPNNEFIIVQGAVDLAVILSTEIWIVDFKSDYVPEGSELTKVEEYKPQLNLYAAALEKVYKRPVKHKWLHLLLSGKTFEVEAEHKRTAAV